MLFLATGLFVAVAIAEKPAGSPPAGLFDDQPPGAKPATRPGENAKEAFDFLFAAEMKKVSSTASPADDADLARRIIEVVPRVQDKPALAGYFLERAYELSLKSIAGHPTAVKAAELLAALEPKPTIKSVDRLLAAHLLYFRDAAPRERAGLADRILSEFITLGDLQGEEGEWDEAQKYYQKALAWQGAKPPGLREELQAKIQNANQQRQAAGQIAALKAKLEKAPGDLETRNALIRLLLVDQDKPEQAAKFLNGEVDERLRTYVPLAAKPPAELAGPVALELAEWYRELAGRAAGPAKITALTRARDYYTRHLGAAGAACADQARLALIQVTAELDKLGPPANWVPPGAILLFNFERAGLSQKDGQTVLRDLSGHDNHGQVRGTTLVKGKAGDAFRFNGAGDSILVRNSPSLPMSGSLTIAMWLQPASLTERRNPIAKCFGGEGAITIEYGGGVYFFYGSSGFEGMPYCGFLLKKPLTTKDWTHIAVVRDLRERKVTWYRNGVPTDSGHAPMAPKATSVNLTIGSGYVAAYHGLMDELGIWNRALSEREIRLLVDAGTKNRPWVLQGRK